MWVTWFSVRERERDSGEWAVGSYLLHPSSTRLDFDWRSNAEDETGSIHLLVHLDSCPGARSSRYPPNSTYF